MTADTPDLTLFIPTAGRVRYLAALFASLELRGDEALEILVGYHGCGETAAPWLAQLPLPPERVRTYAIPAGGGIPANWNAGVQRARGRYVFIMGDDDAFATGGLAMMLAAVGRATGDLVAFEREIIDGEGVPAPDITQAHASYLAGRLAGVQAVDTMNAFPLPPFMSSCYRVAWLREHGFRGEAGGAADVDLFLRAAAKGYRLEVGAGRPVRYRVHAGSFSESGVLIRQSLEVADWNVAQAPAWRQTAAFNAWETFLWRGEINAFLRAGRFDQAVLILRQEGRRFPWLLRVRLALKCRLRIREWRPGRYDTPEDT